MPLTPTVLDAMRYIVSCDAKRLLNFDVSDESLKQLSQITELYLTTQLERGFSALDFYKSLFL
jgi:DNA repair protein RecO (recombination protein O)